MVLLIGWSDGLASNEASKGRVKALTQKFEGNKQPSLSKPPSYPPPPPPQKGPVLNTEKIQKKCQKSPTSRPIRVLAIDGGGVRGLIPALVIAELEKDLKLSVTKIFDAFIGNSAGGLLSLILTKPDISNPQKPQYRASTVVEIVKDMSADIFGGIQKTTLDKVIATGKKVKNLLTTGAQYNPKTLETFAAKKYGETKLSEAVKPVFIATFDLNSETTQVLSTPLAKRVPAFNFKMADIARATSAAPFYFPVHPLEFAGLAEGKGKEKGKGKGKSMQLVDGGVGSNNPTLIGLMDLSKEYCTVPAYEVVSLGTGTAKQHFEKQDMRKKGNPLMMLKPTISGFMSAQAQNADEVTKGFLNILNSFKSDPKSHYTRLQVYLAEGDDTLDDVREQTTQNLTKSAQKIIDSEAYKQTVVRLKKQLCDEGIYKDEGIRKEMCSPAA